MWRGLLALRRGAGPDRLVGRGPADRRQRISLADAVAQQDAFTTTPPETEAILKTAFGGKLTGRMSRARLAHLLTDYAEKSQVQSGLFGDNQTAGEILADAGARYGYGAKTGTTGRALEPIVGDGPGLDFGRTQARGPEYDADGQSQAGSPATGNPGPNRAETGEVTPRRAGLINAAPPDYKPGLVASGPDAANAQKIAWRKDAPQTLDALIAASPANQAQLARVGAEIAAELGIPFADPGVKKTDRILEKIEAGKSPNRINDAVRAGFDVPTPQAADAIVRRLTENFQVIDEGWSKTKTGYFDRTSLVRFPDGQVGEVQFWPPGMLNAKAVTEKGGLGGHAMYEEHRQLPADSPRAVELDRKMNEIYSGVAAKLAPEWNGLFGKRR